MYWSGSVEEKERRTSSKVPDESKGGHSRMEFRKHRGTRILLEKVQRLSNNERLLSPESSILWRSQSGRYRENDFISERVSCDKWVVHNQ